MTKVLKPEKQKQRVPCPIHGCHNKRKRAQVMCAGHWFQVPTELRNRIWNLFRESPGSDEHRQAVYEAIQIVNQKAGQAAPTSPAA